MQHKTDSIASEADADDIEYLICHVAQQWRRLLNIKIKTLGISGTERRALCCIGRNPGMTQVQIAKLLELEPQNLVRLLDKLEGLGWIEKYTDPNDRRVKCLKTTAKSKKIITQIKAISDEVRPGILTGADKKTQQALAQRLADMKVNLAEQLELCEEE